MRSRQPASLTRPGLTMTAGATLVWLVMVTGMRRHLHPAAMPQTAAGASGSSSGRRCVFIL